MGGSYRVIISKQALTDLEKIFAYIEKSSPQNATMITSRLLDAIDGLDVFPNRFGVVGRSRKRGTPVHRMTVRPFLVYYSLDDANQLVSVLTVRHGARRQPKKFP